MPGIFISYRRNESAGQAGRLFDRLAARFGEDRVFMDVDTLVPSEQFATRIEKAIATADVMLVLIGPDLGGAGRPAGPPRRLHPTRDPGRAARRLPARPRLPRRRGDARRRGPARGPAAAGGMRRRRAAARRVRSATRITSPIPLAAFVRPSAEATRRCLSVALARAGWPLSWWAGVVRRTSPRAALAVAAAPLALVWALTVAGAWWQGQKGEPDDFTQLQVTDNAVKATAGFLNGTVTDEVDRIVEDAVVTLSNLDAQRDTKDHHRFVRRVHHRVRGGRRHQPVAPRAGRQQAPLQEVSRDLRGQLPPLPAEPSARNRGGACALVLRGPSSRRRASPWRRRGRWPAASAKPAAPAVKAQQKPASKGAGAPGCGTPFVMPDASFRALDGVRDASVWVDDIDSGVVRGFAPFAVYVVTGKLYAPFQLKQGKLGRDNFRKYTAGNYNTQPQGPLTISDTQPRGQLVFVQDDRRFTLRVTSVQPATFDRDTITLQLCW